MQCIDGAVATDVARCVVCVSVGLSVCKKPLNQLRCRVDGWLDIEGPRNHVLDGVQSVNADLSTWKGTINALVHCALFACRRGRMCLPATHECIHHFDGYAIVPSFARLRWTLVTGPPCGWVLFRTLVSDVCRGLYRCRRGAGLPAGAWAVGAPAAGRVGGRAAGTSRRDSTFTSRWGEAVDDVKTVH